jgi:iron(II)-dependent oxidoreductase
VELMSPSLPEELAGALDRARIRTLDLLAPYDDLVMSRQHDMLMSPFVWDLAHVANYEDIWLLRALGADATRHGLDDLYDAFKQPRRVRESLPLLPGEQARAYGHEVRARVLDLLPQLDFDADGPNPLLRHGFVHNMVVQHEHQHAETLLASIQLLPVNEGHVRTEAATRPAPPAVAAAEVLVPAGPVTMGTDDPWAYDNERPAHRRDLDAFWIDTTPVTNEAYAAFIEAGGYHDERWWSGPGWAWRQEAALSAPQSWCRTDGAWWRHRFGTLEPVPGDEPVQHVCWYEADAYARWAGKRLPTEPEWEKAALGAGGLPHANFGQRHLGPAPTGAYPGGVSAVGCHQMLGDVWEWTSSDWAPYPGFRAFPYEEYSAVFWGPDHKVLRGGSWATDPSVGRVTFRNWDLPIRRQIFAGFRCARDAEPGGGG